MRGIWILAMAMLIAPLPAAAQSTPTLSERMAPLSRLVGEWRGTGWMMLPDGSRGEYQSHESVSIRLSGNALLVEGRHWAPAAPGQLVHDAMAMIVWDQPRNTYRIRSQLANGLGGDFALEPRENGAAWSMETPGGRVEYIIEIDGRTWVERGQRILPDGRRLDFMEMRLTRQ